MSGPLHLARRFLGSLSPRPLGGRDRAWVETVLSPAERALWERMSRADQKHAAGVAREADRLLGGADGAVLVAALLHDVGKVESGLGTFRRVAATLAGAIVGRSRVPGRMGRYLRHDILGAELLRDAGAAPVAVAWARDHHLPPDRWTVPADVGHALAAGDDD